ncbi:nuclear envelope protein [Diplocarpon rosae]|nr:nuclear envelope protein [Diplocarpon rosae]
MMPPAPRIRPYKDFLTPALHRRFALATATLFVLCYAEAVLIGEKTSWFWSWFPLGRVGIRSGLLFIPAFMIFVLRVGQLHVGLRTSYSGWDTFVKYAFKVPVLQTLGWYLTSAWLFSEVYIWSASKDQDLSRTKIIPRTDRTTLNEKPIYVTCFLLFLAVLQAGVHVYYDYDRIDMPTTKTTILGTDGEPEKAKVSAAAQLRDKLPSTAASAVKRSFAMALLSPVIYSMDLWFIPSIRRTMWSATRYSAWLFYTLPKSSALPSTRPFHMGVLKNTFTSGFFLVLLWEVGNTAFNIYVAQEPLKNDRPITYESRDPNGSLLTGLRGKKLQTRAFAFWELVYIAERFEGRRKAIYEDIDRQGGSTWSQVLDICLEVINGIETRIADFERPQGNAPPDPAKIREPPAPGLPRLSQRPKDGLKEPGDLFMKPKRSAIGGVSEYAKLRGQSPPGPSSPTAKKAIKALEGIMIPREQRGPAAGSVGGWLKELALRFLQSAVGTPFRQEYRRRISAVVLGQPFGDVGIIVDAVDAVARFSVCSLKEDKFGNVQRDVSLIIKTLTSTITKLEAFKESLSFHWTDVEKKKESPEVDVVLAALKSGLGDLVTAFGDYYQDLGLSQSDMRMARLAATSAQKPEMITIT